MSARKKHWEQVYASKATTQVSWFQEYPQNSLDLITATGVDKNAYVIDVGGGASTLVDHLLAFGFSNITVLDISATAINSARARLGGAADKVNWLEADITEINLPAHHYALWHDRAVFHFLTSPDDRQTYVNTLLNSLAPGGHAIIATFAMNGPQECSGLPTNRYSPDQLVEAFGPAFRLVATRDEVHETPFGTEQKFEYCLLRRLASR